MKAKKKHQTDIDNRRITKINRNVWNTVNCHEEAMIWVASSLRRKHPNIYIHKTTVPLHTPTPTQFGVSPPTPPPPSPNQWNLAAHPVVVDNKHEPKGRKQSKKKDFWHAHAKSRGITPSTTPTLKHTHTHTQAIMDDLLVGIRCIVSWALDRLESRYGYGIINCYGFMCETWQVTTPAPTPGAEENVFPIKLMKWMIKK